MSNINCAEAECSYMRDGKCTLSIIAPAATDNRKSVAPCPYYQTYGKDKQDFT